MFRKPVQHHQLSHGLTAKIILCCFMLWQMPDAQSQVSPLLDCVEESTNQGSEQLIAHFGYVNLDSEITFDVGSLSNQFLSLNDNNYPSDQGQPSTFQMGQFRRVFSVEFDSSDAIFWLLVGQSISASSNSQQCAEIYPEPQNCTSIFINGFESTQK